VFSLYFKVPLVVVVDCYPLLCEWEAVVSIYNSPGSLSDYVVEGSRFTWHSIEVKLDDKIMASFPQVTEDTVSLGYTTFHVKI